MNRRTCVSLILIGLAGIAHADTRTWDAGGGANTNWTTALNWSGDVVPGGTDIAQFTNLWGADRTVTVDADVEVATLSIVGGGKVTLNGTNTLTLNTALDVVSSYPYEHVVNARLAGPGPLTVTQGTIALYNTANSYASTTLSGSGRAQFVQGSLGSGPVTVYTGAQLFPRSDHSQNLTLSGGSLVAGWKPSSDIGYTASGTITLAAGTESFIRVNDNAGVFATISGTITGTGKVIVEGAYPVADYVTERGTLRLTSANSFSGGLELRLGRIEVRADGALGSGPVVVNAGALTVGATPYNGMRFFNDLTPGNRPASLTVNSDGEASVEPGLTLNQPITLNGGLLTANRSASGTATYNGALTLAADSRIGASQGTLVVTGVIDEDSPANSFKLIRDSGPGATVELRTANAYSGGTEVRQGTLKLVATGTLGSGPVTTAIGYDSGWQLPPFMPYGGKLVTATTAGVFDAVPSVTIQAEGSLDLGTTETKVIEIRAGGALKRTGAGTPVVYSGPGQNIQLYRGAIVDSGLTLPTRAEVTALPGTGFGVYIARTGTTINTAYSVGDDRTSPAGEPDNGTTVLRGLGTAYGDLTYYGTITDVAPGQPGIHLYAQAGRFFQIGAATAATMDTSRLYLHGGGRFIFANASNVLPNTIDSDAWHVRLGNVANLLASGKTLNLASGWLDLDHVNAVQAGATVNLASGVTFGPDVNVASGTFNFAGGSGLYAATNAVISGGATFNIAAGAQVGVSSTGGTFAALPGAGLVDYGLTATGQNNGPTITAGVVLGQDKRITFLPGENGRIATGATNTWAGGEITLAGGATRARICSVNSGSLLLAVSAKVNFGTGTLVIGDTQPFLAMRAVGRAGFGQIAQNGMVQLSNAANVIGAIDIQAGTLKVDASGHFGGATAFNVNSGATFQVDYDNPTFTTSNVTGAGTLLIGNGASGTSTLKLLGGSIAPGSRTGILNVAGKLTLDTDGLNNAKLAIEANTHAGIAGTSHDQLAATGAVTLTNADLQLALAAPSVAFRPALVDAAILTGSTVSGTFATITQAAPAMAGDPAVIARIPTFWDLGSDDLVYDAGAVRLVLDAADWTAVSGDANLDGHVNISDLTVLANNYGKVGTYTWLNGDFNLDGILNVSDLTLMANNYGKFTDDVVPEPMTLGLLAVGGLALIRRKRA